MPETPDDILRALADPERLSIAGTLVRGESTATALAETLQIPIKRVRMHLNRLAATGVARVTEAAHVPSRRRDPPVGGRAGRSTARGRHSTRRRHGG